MELEEMKTLWTEMSAEMEKQKTITNSIVLKMTQNRYKSKLNKILVPEIAGSIVCFAGMVFTLINIEKLHPWYLLACGIATVVILFFLSWVPLKYTRRIHAVNIADKNYKQLLQEYSINKKHFVLVQKANVYLSTVLLLVILPVTGMLIGGRDLFKETNLYLFYAVSFSFLYPVCKWVFKRYSKIVTDAENMLKALEE